MNRSRISGVALWSLSLGAWTLGFAIYLLLRPHLGGIAAALLVVPGGVTGWWLGLRSGTILTVLMISAWRAVQIGSGSLTPHGALHSLFADMIILSVTILAGYSSGMHQRMQEAARTAEAHHVRAEALLKDSTDLIFVLDRDGRISDAGPKAACLAPMAQIIGTEFASLVVAADREQVRTILREAAGGTKRTTSLDCRMDDGKGRTHWLTGTVRDVCSDPLRGELVLNLHDDTRERRRMADLSFQALLLSSVGDGLVGIDERRRIHHWNRPMTTMTGIPEKAALGRAIDEVCPTIANVIHGALEDDGSTATARCATAGLQLSGADGRTTPVSLTITPLSDGAGLPGDLLARLDDGPPAPRGHLCVVSDMTERETLERLARANLKRELDLQNAREGERLRRDLLNAAAHELATPLTPLDLQLDLLLSGQLGSLEPKQRAAVEVLQRNVHRLEGTIGRILAASSKMRPAELGPKVLTALPVLVDEAMAHARTRAHEKHIRLSLFQDGATPVMVPCDPEALHRAIANLMDAVVASAPLDGEVWVEIHDRAAYLEVTVSDVSNKATTLVGSASSATQSPLEAADEMELSLQVSRNLVHAHGGHLKICASRSGNDLRATIMLPTNTNRATEADLLFEGTRDPAVEDLPNRPNP